MKLRVIEGGRATDDGKAARPEETAVLAEAARRLREVGYESARTRRLLTGQPVPREMQYLQLQIEFAAAALAALSSLPADFRDDRYWPQPMSAAG